MAKLIYLGPIVLGDEKIEKDVNHKIQDAWYKWSKLIYWNYFLLEST